MDKITKDKLVKASLCMTFADDVISVEPGRSGQEWIDVIEGKD